MQNIINEIIIWLQNLVSSTPIGISIFLGMLIIVIESIIPERPLGIFIALNVHLFGNVLGLTMSWVATSIGCSLSFFIVRKLFNKKLERKFKKDGKIHNILKRIDKLDLSSLVLIITLPFTPAFAINIAAGLSNMSYKKFIIAILIAKVFIVLFWGYIGTSFLQSVTDIWVIIKICLMMLGAYIISKVVMKKYRIE